jgi:hypothetical protein
LTETTLDQHMALVGRAVAAFISNGLSSMNVDSRAPEKLLGTQEDPKIFASVLQWMLDEQLIRARNIAKTVDGTIHLAGAQLTAKGIAIVKQPLQGGDTIEKRIQSAEGDGLNWSSIGDLIGGIAGGFTKALASGG